jgi:3-carboxy-cis,cis-muconate cycloisomerase
MSDFQRVIYDALVGEPAVDLLWTDTSIVAAMLEVEAALAKAQASVGVIPQRAAEIIARCTGAAHYDLAALASEAAKSGNIAIPLIAQLTERVARIDEDAARYVHWGATSQDIIDTATVLTLRATTEFVLARLERAADAAATLAERHVSTVMAGRTWLQHATPTTFGLKAAGWMAALDRAHARIEASLNDAMTLQFGGASGTLAALGDRGISVATALANELALRQPELPWHAQRDNFATFAATLGVSVGSMGKIARDIALLAQTEVAEAFEGGGEGAGGSSAMPQKRNPVGVSVVLAASVRAPGLVATMLAALPQEHERALGGWQAEWETLPALVRLAAGAARHTAELLGALQVDANRMRANVDITNGASLAEAVSMALAVHIGKFDAHRTIGEAAKRAIADKRPLLDVLAEAPAVSEHLTRNEIERLLTPENYLGVSATFVRDALARHARYRNE